MHVVISPNLNRAWRICSLAAGVSPQEVIHRTGLRALSALAPYEDAVRKAKEVPPPKGATSPAAPSNGVVMRSKATSTAEAPQLGPPKPIRAVSSYGRATPIPSSHEIGT